MRTALERFLARPTALRTLRDILRSHDFSTTAWLSLSPRSRRARARHASKEQLKKSTAIPRDETSGRLGDHTGRARPTLNKEHGQEGSEGNAPIIRATGLKRSPVESNGITRRYISGVDGQKYWAYLLAERERLQGITGVRQTWQEMQENKIDLPCHGPHARILWDTLTIYPEMFEEIYIYAIDLQKRTGQTWQHLYHSIVGYEMRLGSVDALKWHLRIYKWYTPSINTMKALTRAALASPESLWVFRKIYLKTPKEQRFVHDTLVPLLYQEKTVGDTVRWHKFLMAHGDYPMRPQDPELQRVLGKLWKQDESDMKDNVSELQSKPSARLSEANPEQPEGQGESKLPMSPDMKLRMGDLLRNTKPSELSDSFCARLFATKAFPVHSVIQGMAMFSVSRIGPLALRELAARVSSAKVLTGSLKLLKDQGIDLGMDTFSRLIRKLVEDGRTDSLSDMLSSDHHPDVYDDPNLIRRLLAAYIDRDDWKNAHRMLLVLTFAHQNPEQERWNILLRYYCEKKNWQKIKQVMQDMERNHTTVTQESLTFLSLTSLAYRRKAKRPVHQFQANEDLQNVVSVTQSAMKNGLRVGTGHWREIIKRLGMTERHDELHKLLFWLAGWYSGKHTDTHKPTSFELRGADWQHGAELHGEVTAAQYSRVSSASFIHPLRQIFRPVRIAAIIEWSFKKGFLDIDQRSPNAKVFYSHPLDLPHPQHTYLRGLHFLSGLMKRGVWIDRTTVKNALTRRLWILYGPGMSHHRQNRRARRINPYSFEQMVWEIHNAWPHWTIFPDVDEEALSMLVGQRMVTRTVTAGESSGPEADAAYGAGQMTSTTHRSPTASDAPSSVHGGAFDEDALGLWRRRETDGLLRQGLSPGSLPLKAPRSIDLPTQMSYTPIPSPNSATSSPANAPTHSVNSATRLRARVELAIAIFGLRPFVAGRKRAVRMNASLWPAVVRSWMRREEEVKRRTLPPRGDNEMQVKKKGRASAKSRSWEGPEDSWVLTGQGQGLEKGDGGGTVAKA